MDQIQKFKELLANKSINRPVIINFLIVVLIIVVYLGLFLTPKIKEFFRLLPEASRLKTNIVNIKKEWTDIDSFDARISGLYKKLDSYEKKLPGEKEIPAVLGYLSEAAKEMDVRITEIKPIEQDKTPAPALYYKVPILLKSECGYHQLGRFLNRLESADRFMKISDIKMVTNPGKADIHNVQLIVVTYVMEK